MRVRCLCFVLFALGTGAGDVFAQTIEPRASVIARAQVWKPTDVAAMDLTRGPELPGSLEPGQTVRCDFTERQFEGQSPKFACVTPEGEELKVKYGEGNGEVPGEIAATRLLWALGFGADVMTPVRLICRGCPDYVSGRAIGPLERLVHPAVVEHRMPGRTIAHTSEEWAWPELDLIRQDAGGAPAAHRDALKLLAVFLQHGDSKPEQQRLVCLDQDTEAHDSSRCEHPFMLLDDVGLTFGRANLANANPVAGMNLREWSQVRVWKDDARCVGNLPKSLTGTLKDPVISEDGREFLADRMAELSDAQIYDLFEVSGVDDTDKWVEAFKAKRQEILDRRCDVLWPDGIATLFGTGPVLWLQAHASPSLTAVMNGISLLGYTRVYLAMALALAFLVRLRAGVALLLLLALNGVLTDAAKAVVSSPRPVAVDSRVQTLSAIEALGETFRNDSALPAVDSDDGYGFPSGHVSATTAFLFGVMYLFGWPWVWRAMVFWIPAMALSRLYLGSHFLGDVLGGVGMGVIAAAIGFLALTLARLSNPDHAHTAIYRTVGLGVFLAVCTFVTGVPAAYDTGRFLGLAIGAAWVVAYVGPRWAAANEIVFSARIGSLLLAAFVFGVSGWATRVTITASELTDTYIGTLLLGGLPVLVLVPLSLYLSDRLLVKRAFFRAGA